MFQFINRKLQGNGNITYELPIDTRSQPLNPDLSKNKLKLKEIFSNCADFTIHPIYIGDKQKILFFYLDGLVDNKTLINGVLNPFLYQGYPDALSDIESLGQIIERKILSTVSIQIITNIDEIVDGILKGYIAILVDGEAKALITDMKNIEQRGIEEPETEVTVRGPRDGFNESLQTNISMIRKRIKSARLKFTKISVGDISKTDVMISYIDGIVSNTLLQEVKNRIEGIKIDAILESGYIEEMIEDNPFTPFPQIQNTERPDTVVSSLLEGKVSILVDNTPFALIVPMSFWTGFQAAEDAYKNYIYVSFIRIIRFLMFSITVFLPSFYVALTTFHPKLIPTSLFISIAAARENVPFPIIIETLLMEVIFEGLREAGIRLPRAVGSAVSIVGAIVIGEAAVQAGIVSAPTVIVVATTGIASFVIPRYNMGAALRIIRFPMLIFSGILGLYGIVTGFIATIIHLVNIQSFGIPYFTPLAPQIPSDIKNILIRTPKWSNTYGPFYTFGRNKPRIPHGQKPHPRKGD